MGTQVERSAHAAWASTRLTRPHLRRSMRRRDLPLGYVPSDGCRVEALRSHLLPSLKSTCNRSGYRPFHDLALYPNHAPHPKKYDDEDKHSVSLCDQALQLAWRSPCNVTKFAVRISEQVYSVTSGNEGSKLLMIAVPGRVLHGIVNPRIPCLHDVSKKIGSPNRPPLRGLKPRVINPPLNYP